MRNTQLTTKNHQIGRQISLAEREQIFQFHEIRKHHRRNPGPEKGILLKKRT